MGLSEYAGVLIEDMSPEILRRLLLELEAKCKGYEAKIQELTDEKGKLGQSLFAAEREYYTLENRARAMAASITNPPATVPRDEYEKQTRDVEALAARNQELCEELATEKHSRKLLLRVLERLVEFDGD